MTSERKRVRVYISGRVQGVFFRAKTRNEALRNNVMGWVRNMPDGRVEAVFEGTPEGVDHMVHWCRIGPSLAVVESVDVLEESCSGAFRDFEIRRGP